MSEPQRRQVRVRRSPKVGVFLALGAALGVVVAVVAVNLTPDDPATPAAQAIGFLAVLLAPVGALLGGLVALLLDAVADRRARVLEAERVRPATATAVPVAPEDGPPAGPEDAADADAAAEAPAVDREGRAGH